MTASVRNRLLALGFLWGILLAAVPALVMTDPYRLSGLLVASLVCAALSGCVGTLVAGRRATLLAARSGGAERSSLLAGVRTGASQGLVGGGVAALIFWGIMAVSISGFTLQNPVELSVLMEPDVFLGSFFVALSVFLYVLVGGLLLGPVFGTLVNRTVRARGKEDLVVR
ncbi:MAG TPA: hypothetical protein VI027_15565 [Rubrobacteraceae bacterium]|jgi:hypothetical protein